ncbi:hypothetical protein MVES1_002522 [Malassezia vespertilionis]|uniref:CRAL-TRIO domain-containing protein n=1 Tax=Malassezia vespertilionis TaxID=2020962 RepID=A0A2N1JAJ0_9BASI|nr:uncharacterized protein MVES1_002522 [Malassezia vespertilionis]PKI83543.1 hypothetical protein MVES_002381 [Malassezia vespertilionis]WFD07164.1 hypothetical protein MVES1_002522 [Malassezia vespertilionis]
MAAGTESFNQFVQRIRPIFFVSYLKMLPFAGRSREPSVSEASNEPVPSNRSRKSFPNIFGSNAGTPSAPSPKSGNGSESQSPAGTTAAQELNDFTPPPGHHGNLTESQESALEELKAALLEDKLITSDPEPKYQETQLLRFLRARSFNVQLSREMYTRAREWKQSINLADLCDKFEFTERAQIAEYGWRMYFHKTDKVGRPIFIQDMSKLNSDKVFKTTTPERIIQNFAVTLEKAVQVRYDACTQKEGHLVDDNFMVLNVAGLGFSTFWSMRQQLQHLLSVLDDNFPELSGRVQIINAPYLFTTVWAYVKNWIPTHTAEKIDICGTDYINVISEFIDMENWPEYLGGKCKCAGGSCQTRDEGPWEDALKDFDCQKTETIS